MTARVASFGSVNVDCVRQVSAGDAARWAERYDWFPAAGETVCHESVTEADLPPPDRTRLGGKGANQAVAAARAGASASFYGRVGPDASDHRVREMLADREVDVSAVETVDVETGKAHVFVDETGENRIVVVPGANGRVDAAYAERHLAAIAAADCLLLQNEVPVPVMDTLLDALDGRAGRPVVVLDPAPAEGVAPLVAHDCIDYVTPNEHEYETLADAGALDTYGGTVVRTRGEADLLVDGAAGAFALSPPPADPVDTTGAGDAFNGCLAARIAAGDDLRSALSLAAAAGALATEAEGAQSVPGIEAIRRRARG